MYGSLTPPGVRWSELFVLIVRGRPIKIESLLDTSAAAIDTACHHGTGSAVPAVDQIYEYLRPSVMGTGTGDLYLSTSGGTSAGALEAHPRFFDGFVELPEVTAAGLLVCARVAGSRFYTPANMLKAILRAADPVVTSNGDRLRFESFSACGGVYARLDLPPEALADAPLSTGTTNVDLNKAVRDSLARIGPGEPLHLRVGLDELTVTTLDGAVVERRVPLPQRWLKGFAEVQVAAAGMQQRVELSSADARRFLRSLPAASRGSMWAVPAGRSLRLSAKAGAGAIGASGPERLRVLEPLLRFATALRVYGPACGSDDGAPSAWELDLGGARFTAVISPAAGRGFSGEGGVLHDLADEDAADDADIVSAALTWQAVVDVDALARSVAIAPERVRRALTRLGTAGRIGFDLADGAFFHRELPYDRAAMGAMHPRLLDARVLVEKGAVRATDAGATVTSNGVEHRVTWTTDGARCTCPWWSRHRGDRGPCKHVLAAEMSRG
jgi:hypothetical protein